MMRVEAMRLRARCLRLSSSPRLLSGLAELSLEAAPDVSADSLVSIDEDVAASDSVGGPLGALGSGSDAPDAYALIRQGAVVAFGRSQVASVGGRGRSDSIGGSGELAGDGPSDGGVWRSDRVRSAVDRERDDGGALRGAQEGRSLEGVKAPDGEPRSNPARRGLWLFAEPAQVPPCGHAFVYRRAAASGAGAAASRASALHTDASRSSTVATESFSIGEESSAATMGLSRSDRQRYRRNSSQLEAGDVLGLCLARSIEHAVLTSAAPSDPMLQGWLAVDIPVRLRHLGDRDTARPLTDCVELESQTAPEDPFAADVVSVAAKRRLSRRRRRTPRS